MECAFTLYQLIFNVVLIMSSMYSIRLYDKLANITLLLQRIRLFVLLFLNTDISITTLHISIKLSIFPHRHFEVSVSHVFDLGP